MKLPFKKFANKLVSNWFTLKITLTDLEYVCITKDILKALETFYGILPGNDVIIIKLLKYCSLIGYCHGGREIYKVELWEAFVWKPSSSFLCVAEYRVFNGRKALVFTLIFHVWISNKRWFAVIADDRCNDERRLARWVLCASTQNEKLHETLLRLHFKTLFRWKVQNPESLYADFLFHSLLSFVVSPCNFLLLLHLLCVPGRIATYKNNSWMQRR